MIEKPFTSKNRVKMLGYFIFRKQRARLREMSKCSETPSVKDREHARSLTLARSPRIFSRLVFPPVRDWRKDNLLEKLEYQSVLSVAEEAIKQTERFVHKIRTKGK